jgi:hypothetical protein
MRCNHETRGEFMITHYADDTDFITGRVEDQQVIAKRVPEVMGRYKLLMNPTKTEYIELCRGHAKTTENKKLGSIFSSDKDIITTRWRERRERSMT